MPVIPKDLESEYILGVALKVIHRTNLEEFVYQLPRPNRHHNLFSLKKELRDDNENAGVVYYNTYYEKEGFYSNKRQFLTREEALIVAKDAHQLIQKTCPRTELFSEDLWSNVLMFDKEGNNLS
jgi:hypothetical protein